LKEPKRQFLCSHTKKHDNGVHIIPPVFTSFLQPAGDLEPTQGGVAGVVAVCAAAGNLTLNFRAEKHALQLNERLHVAQESAEVVQYLKNISH
jgi:hypothetical protein